MYKFRNNVMILELKNILHNPIFKNMGQERGQIMARKGENIRKRTYGRWEGRYIFHQDGITKIKSVYAPTYTEVKQKLIKQKNMVAEQALLSSKETSKEDKAALLTLGKVAEEWLTQIESQVGKELKYSTYTKYKYVYRRYFRKLLFEGINRYLYSRTFR